MRKKIYTIFLTVFTFVAIFSVVSAFAADPAAVTSSGVTSSVNLASDSIKKSFESIGGKLKSPAIGICVFLVGMQMIWNVSVGYISEGKFDLQSVTVVIMRGIITLTMCRWLVGYAPDFFKGMQEGITGLLGNKPASLSSLISTAFDMAQAPQNALSVLITKSDFKIGLLKWANDFQYVACALACGIASFIILVAMFMAYMTALVAEAKLIICSAFAVLAVGFSGCSYTRDIARRGIGQVLSTSIELLVIYTLMAASQDVFNSFKSVVLVDWYDAYAYCFQCILAGLILSALYQQIPGIISGMFGGIGGGGGGSLVGLSMAGAAATGALSMAQNVASGGKSAVSGAGKVIGGTAGTISAVRKHMPAGGGGVIGGIKRVGSGIGGAVKEGVRNRASSMKEAISRKGDSILGRKEPEKVQKVKIVP